jgi:hypothetical protein
MTGFVLALAGLAVGNGGPGMGAARAPVAVNFDGNWQGTLHTPRGNIIPIRLGRGTLTLIEGRITRFPFVVKVTGANTFRVTEFRPHSCLGIYRLQAGEATLCFGLEPGLQPSAFERGPDQLLFVLRPAAPPKG